MKKAAVSDSFVVILLLKLMAIEVCSEVSSVGISPRISFSYDLNQADLLHSSSDFNRDRLDLTLLESDFDFCIGNLLKQDLSSADELFSNGKILPVEIKKSIEIEPNREEVPKPNDESAPVPPDPSRNSVSSEKKSLKELLSASEDQKPQSKSFWQFKRSSSLNCESAKSRSLIRSLHFLSRSNSTGSALNHPKPQSHSKDSQRPNLQKQASISSTRKSSSACSSCSNSYQKPPMRKNFGSSNGNGNGVRIMSPLLNLPPPYISKVTVSFFGFGSLFCNGKNKKKNK